MLFEALYLAFTLGSEKAQQNAAARQVAAWDAQLKQMDIWDGVEHQIEEHCKFYDKRIVPRMKYFVRFGGDKDKYRNISMVDVQANRNFWSSGLSATDYAIKYFKDKFQENPQWEDEFEVYRSDCTSIKELNLFNRAGDEVHFSLEKCYGRQYYNSKQHRCLQWWGTKCEPGDVIISIFS